MKDEWRRRIPLVDRVLDVIHPDQVTAALNNAVEYDIVRGATGRIVYRCHTLLGSFRPGFEEL